MHNDNFYTKKLGALGIALALAGVVFVAGSAVESKKITTIGGQTAGGCSLTDWSFGVSSCLPPGPGKCTGSDKPGKDMCPCKASGSFMGQSFTVSGFCMAGCCKGVKWIDGGAALDLGGAGSWTGQILGQAAGQVLQQLLGNLMGGGAGGGGGSSSYDGSATDYGTSDDGGLLTFDTFGDGTDSSSSDGFTLTDWIFSDDGTQGGQNGTQNTNTNTNTNSSDPGTQQSSGQSGDVVTTTYGGVTYHNGQAVDVDYISGMSDVEADLANVTLDTGEDAPKGTVLTREELERQALEEQARLAQLGGGEGSLSVSYESTSQDELNALTDYGSSNVARSQRGTTPSGSSDSQKEGDEPLWQKVVSFVKLLFGAK